MAYSPGAPGRSAPGRSAPGRSAIQPLPEPPYEYPRSVKGSQSERLLSSALEGLY